MAVLWDFKTTLIHACKRSKPLSRKMRSDIYWFAEICNSQCLSHFAASFIASRAEVSIVKGMFEMFRVTSVRFLIASCQNRSSHSNNQSSYAATICEIGVHTDSVLDSQCYLPDLAMAAELTSSRVRDTLDRFLEQRSELRPLPIPYCFRN